MGEYHGPAVLAGPDGHRVEVAARVRSRSENGLTTWDGTVSGHADWLSMEGVLLSLRIGDRTSDCYISHAELRNPLAAVTIVGDGAPPFD